VRAQEIFEANPRIQWLDGAPKSADGAARRLRFAGQEWTLRLVTDLSHRAKIQAQSMGSSRSSVTLAKLEGAQGDLSLVLSSLRDLSTHLRVALSEEIAALEVGQ